MLVTSFSLEKMFKYEERYNTLQQRTRLKAFPDPKDLHRFFAPESDLSFGNCATAEVEKSRAVPKTRVIDSIFATNRERH